MNIDFMSEAFKCAKMAFDLDEVPIGAVIVKDNVVISASFNKKESMNCCTAHAEILAIEEASKYLNNWRLDDCDIYITLDPCIMCASAIKQARISNIYTGTKNINNIDNLLNEIFDSKDINDKVNFYSDLDHDRCSLLLKKFFKERR